MLKKIITGLLAVLVISLSLCGSTSDWKEKFNTDLPDVTDGNWVKTLHTDFTKITNMEELNAANWAPSPHGKRRYEYWCDQMIDFTKNGLIIHSQQMDNHTCDVCGVSEGVFTGGIETRKSGESSELLFAQAFGYFEATVIVPRGSGMWSAFWLQSDNTGKIGHRGKDGSEIDIYESSFMRNNPTKTGQAIHYDAYDPPFYKSQGSVADVQKNLYDGEPHTYALKWTPKEYVIYVDGEAVWASNYGGISRTPEYLRLTVEIRDTLYGPYGQEIGTFENRQDGANDFIIKDVKVYQNKEFTSSIKAVDDYKDMEKVYIGLIAGAGVLGGAAVLALVAVGIKCILRKKKKNSGL